MSFCCFFSQITDLRKGDDPTEGGRGGPPSPTALWVGNICIYLNKN
jgi:hypothetical protein